MKSKLFLTIILLFAVTACTANGKSASLEISDMSPTARATPSPTITSEATSSPTETALPVTQTLTPTALPPATITPYPSPSPVLEELPVTSNDLLFIADGSLKIWRHNPAEINTLIASETTVTLTEPYKKQRLYSPFVGDIASLTISDDGKQVIIAKLTSKSPFTITTPGNPRTNMIGTYEILYLNLISGEQRMLLDKLHSIRPPKLALSPDGQYLAVSGAGIDAVGDIREENGQLVANLYLQQMAVGTTTQIIDNCIERCTGIVWHADNGRFVYGNQDGLKMYTLSAPAPELLVDSAVSDEYPLGQQFSPDSWANNGRYLLTWYTYQIEGSVRAIFDITTKNLMLVPNAYSHYGGPYAQLAWMHDQRIFLVRSDYDTQAIGEIFRVDADNEQIILDETVLLSVAENFPYAPIHWKNGGFSYALLNINGDVGFISDSNGVYQRKPLAKDAEYLNNMPVTSFSPVAIWEEENRSGLVVGEKGSMWYVSANGDAIQDMQTAVGNSAHSFHWLP